MYESDVNLDNNFSSLYIYK